MPSMHRIAPRLWLFDGVGPRVSEAAMPKLETTTSLKTEVVKLTCGSGRQRLSKHV